MKTIRCFTILSVLLLAGCVASVDEAPELDRAVEISLPVVEPNMDEPVKYPVTDGYSVRYEAANEDGITEATSLAYLWYEDVKLIDAPLNDFSDHWYEFLVKNVYQGEDEDIVFVIGAGGCGGCVGFLDRYFVVDKSDLSVKMVSFEAPTGVDLFRRGAPAWSIFSERTHEMAYVNSFGDLEDPTDSYREEIWVYRFDTDKWALVDALDSDKTVQCIGMGTNLDERRVSYGDAGLNVAPIKIEGEMFCEY